MIKVLSVDLWDTIIQSERGPVESYALMKLEALWRALSKSRELAFNTVLEIYSRVIEYKGVVPPAMFARIITLLLGYPLNSEAVEEATREYEEASYRYTPTLVPGARELLRFAKEMGLKLVVVTNTSFSAKAIERVLCNADLCNLVDYIASSADLGLMKPNPAIFHVALKAVGAEPWEAVHVGDSCIRDVIGAILAGLKPVLYVHRKASFEACKNIPDLTLARSLYEVLDVIKSLARL